MISMYGTVCFLQEGWVRTWLTFSKASINLKGGHSVIRAAVWYSMVHDNLKIEVTLEPAAMLLVAVSLTTCNMGRFATAGKLFTFFVSMSVSPICLLCYNYVIWSKMSSVKTVHLLWSIYNLRLEQIGSISLCHFGNGVQGTKTISIPYSAE